MGLGFLPWGWVFCHNMAEHGTTGVALGQDRGAFREGRGLGGRSFRLWLSRRAAPFGGRGAFARVLPPWRPGAGPLGGGCGAFGRRVRGLWRPGVGAPRGGWRAAGVLIGRKDNESFLNRKTFLGFSSSGRAFFRESPLGAWGIGGGGRGFALDFCGAWRGCFFFPAFK